MRGRCRPGTVFVYSGQGSQWAGMGRQLLADEPAFAAAVAELEPDFVAQTGFSLHQVLAGGEPVVGIDRIQPVLVGMQLALTALWRSYGVHPDAVIGHSMGEVTAAVVAGALTPAEGLRVIATRSRLMARLSGQGAMALLELDAGRRGADRRLPRGDGGGLCLAAPDGDRRPARAGRRGDRGGARAEPAGPPHRTSTWPPTTRSSIRSCPSCGAALADLAPADARRSRSSPPSTDTAGPHRCLTPTTGWPTCATRCGSARPSPPPAPTTHLHRDQPAPAAHPRHQRHPGRHASPQPGHPAARHPRHAHLPHQPQRHPHHPPAAHRAPTRTAPAAAHHPVAPHPALDHCRFGASAGRDIRCWGSVSRIRRTAPGCGRARWVRIFCGLVITASTTCVFCPGRRTPSWRWRR